MTCQESQHDTTDSTTILLELRIHATGIPRSGILRKLPSCWTQVDVLEGPMTSTSVSANRKRWGKTEVVPMSSNPQWTTTLTLEYRYGSEVYFYVTVYSIADNNEHEVAGGALFSVSDVLGIGTKAKRLPKGGCVYCTLERTRNKGEMVFKCRFQALSLKTSKLKWGLDTYLEIAKKETNNNGSSWITIFRSPPVLGSTSPTFDPLRLLGIDWNISLRISVWVYKQNKILGSCETTFQYLFEAQTTRSVEEQSPKDLVLAKPGSNRAEVGKLRVWEAETRGDSEFFLDTPRDDDDEDEHEDASAVEVMPFSWIGGGGSAIDSPVSRGTPQKSFRDYINGGMEIDMVVAIDYTSSNGDPRHPESLHYQTPESLNDYEEVISTVGDALASYSTSKQFPVFGFGAKFAGEVRHIFQCGPTKDANGVDGVLQAYRSVFQSDVIMSGPTVLDQVIQVSAMRAQRYQQAQSDSRYCVLLIITDGIVSEDLEGTKRKLAVYSQLPLSIIICGVGRHDFEPMHSLSSPIPDARRNTTCVRFREHQQDPTSLAKAALEYLPEQIVEYFQSRRKR
jgi:hypothetical protein